MSEITKMSRKSGKTVRKLSEDSGTVFQKLSRAAGKRADYLCHKKRRLKA
jgi:hypothetical protein